MIISRYAQSLALAGLLWHGHAQVLNEFDTSTGGFIILCKSDPAFCAFEYDDYSSTDIIFATGGENIAGVYEGLFACTTPTCYFAAQNCQDPDGGCTFLCDDVCLCETGTLVTIDGRKTFQPDGGSCEVLSSKPGTVPTPQPTPAPTAAPTFDMDTSVLYNATDMVDSLALRVTCGGNWPIEGSYCDQVSGRLSSSLQNPSMGQQGWTMCNQNGVDDCVVACSPDCTCEVATLTAGGAYDETVPTTPCEVIEPTPAPTSMPTTTPTSGSAGLVCGWEFRVS